MKIRYIYQIVKDNSIKIKTNSKLLPMQTIYFIAKAHRMAAFYLNRKHSWMSAPKTNSMAVASPNQKLSLMSSVTGNA